MARKIHGLRRKVRATTSATTHTADAEAVRTGEIWWIERVLLRNQTRANSDIEVYISGRGSDHAVGVIENIGDNFWGQIEVDLRLYEGEYLRFQWSDVVSGDVLDMHYNGHVHYRRELE